MKIVGSPLDFVGINVYIPSMLVMASDWPSGYREVAFNVSHLKMFSSWHRLAPLSQYWSAAAAPFAMWNQRATSEGFR